MLSPTGQYHTLLENILDNGNHCENRTGIDTKSVFGRVLRFDISEGKVPLLHSKKVFTKGIFHELVWMLSGNTNIDYLKKHGVSIWDSWVKPGTEVYEELTQEQRYELYVAKHKADTAKYLECVKSSPDEPLIQMYPPQMDPMKPDLVSPEMLDVHQIPRTRLVAGELPKIYQHQWRRWDDTRVIPIKQLEGFEQKGFKVTGYYNGLQGDEEAMCVVRREIDQIQNLVDKLRKKPDDRRIILSAWNVAEIDEMALPPCHTLLHLKPYKMSLTERVDISEDRDIPLEEVPTYRLSGLLYQRSADYCLGVPFNIVQYTLLIQMLAHVSNMETGEFVWVGGDCHVYEDQVPTAIQQLQRPVEALTIPRIILNPEVKNIFDFTVEDIEVIGYNPEPVLKYPAAAV